MHVLGWLATHGIAWFASWQAVRLVHVILDYRVRVKEIELRREQSGLIPGHQPAPSARARHARPRH